MENGYDILLQIMRNWYNKLNDSKILNCIRNSLVMMIPILLVGSFSLVLRSVPIEVYQNFLDEAWGEH